MIKDLFTLYSNSSRIGWSSVPKVFSRNSNFLLLCLLFSQYIEGSGSKSCSIKRWMINIQCIRHKILSDYKSSIVIGVVFQNIVLEIIWWKPSRPNWKCTIQSPPQGRMSFVWFTPSHSGISYIYNSSISLSVQCV